eukprot:876931-Prymnesium_polylepis.1
MYWVIDSVPRSYFGTGFIESVAPLRADERRDVAQRSWSLFVSAELQAAVGRWASRPSASCRGC